MTVVGALKFRGIITKRNRAAVITDEGRLRYVRKHPSVIRPQDKGTKRGDIVNGFLKILSDLIGPGRRELDWF